MAVITAGELQKIRAPGKSAGEADGAHRRLRPRIAHPHHLHPRHTGDNGFRQLRLRHRRRAKTETILRRLLHRVNNPRMGMTDNRRAIRADKINITAAIDIKNISPFRTGNKARRTADPAKRAHR